MQRYKCKDCGYNFVEGDKRCIEGSEAMKALCLSFYGLMKGTFRCMGELCGASHVTIYRWIRGMIEEVEIDELWHYIGKKCRKKWILKAVNRKTGKTIAWVTGGRDIETVKRLYAKLEHLKNAIFYTDDLRRLRSCLTERQACYR